MLLNVAEIHGIGYDLGIFRVGVLDKQADDRWFHLGRGSRNASPRSNLQVVHVSEVPGFLDVLMLERHTASLHLRRGALFQQFQIIAKARAWKVQDVKPFS